MGILTKTTESTFPRFEKTSENLDYHEETHDEDENQENVDDDPEKIRRRLNLTSHLSHLAAGHDVSSQLWGCSQ